MPNKLNRELSECVNSAKVTPKYSPVKSFDFSSKKKDPVYVLKPAQKTPDNGIFNSTFNNSESKISAHNSSNMTYTNEYSNTQRMS